METHVLWGLLFAVAGPPTLGVIAVVAAVASLRGLRHRLSVWLKGEGHD